MQWAWQGARGLWSIACIKTAVISLLRFLYENSFRCLIEIVVLERFWRVTWTTRRSNQSILKDIKPEYSLEGLMLKLKLQYFGHLMQRADSLEKKPWCWEILKAGGEGDNRGWDGWMASGHGFGWTPGVGDGQRGLACWGSWGRKESDTTERMNWYDIL